MTPAAAAEATQDIRTPKWERELRIRLATMCMAVLCRDKNDLKHATDDVVEFVRMTGELD